MENIEVRVPKSYGPKAASGEKKVRKEVRKSKSGKRVKKRKYLYANAPHGYRMLVSRKALREVVPGMVSSSFHEFVDHFLRHKAVDIVRASDSVAKIQCRSRVGLDQVTAGISTVFRAGAEELASEDSFEPQMIKAAQDAVRNYLEEREAILAAKAKKAAEKKAKAERDGVEPKKPRILATRSNITLPYRAAHAVLQNTVAEAIDSKLGGAGEEKKADAAPAVSMSWAETQKASKLSIDVVRVHNLAQEVCSDTVSYTRLASVALAGALNYLFEDIVIHAKEFAKDSKTLSYAHLQRSVFSVSHKEGPRIVDPEAFKLLSPYLKNTPGLRAMRVEHSDPAWNFLAKTFPDRSLRPAPKRPRKEDKGAKKPAAKKAKPAMPVIEGEPAAGDEEATEAVAAEVA